MLTSVFESFYKTSLCRINRLNMLLFITLKKASGINNISFLTSKFDVDGKLNARFFLRLIPKQTKIWKMKYHQNTAFICFVYS